MPVSEQGAGRPRVTVGPATEFSLFFRVKPNDGGSLWSAWNRLGYGKNAVEVIHVDVG